MSINNPGRNRARLCTLTENEIERIHDGALQTLARTGLTIHDEAVLILLDEAGCRVDHEARHVRVPAQVIENAVATAPPVVTLYNRRGEQVMALGAGPV